MTSGNGDPLNNGGRAYWQLYGGLHATLSKQVESAERNLLVRLDETNAAIRRLEVSVALVVQQRADDQLAQGHSAARMSVIVFGFLLTILGLSIAIATYLRA